VKKDIIIKSIIAGLDQAVLTLTNFVTALILIQSLSKSDYGLYATLLPIILLFLAVQNALINTPMSILLIKKTDDKKTEYVNSLFTSQILVVLPLLCLIIAAVFILERFGFSSLNSVFVTSFSLAVVGLLLRDFLTSTYYANEIPPNALKTNFGYSVLFLLSLLISSYLSFISLPFTYLFMGTSALSIFLLKSKLKFNITNLSLLKKYFLENWQFGRWAIMGIVITHLQTYSYIYIISLLLSSEAVAEISAARIFLTPLVLLPIGWGKISRPRGSKFKEQNKKDKIIKEQIIASGIFVIISAIYIFILIYFHDELRNMFLTENYDFDTSFFLKWGIIVALRILANNASFGLMSIGRFDWMTKLEFVILILSITLIYMLIKVNGLTGALDSMMIISLVAVVPYWVIFYKAIKRIK